MMLKKIGLLLLLSTPFSAMAGVKSISIKIYSDRGIVNKAVYANMKSVIAQGISENLIEKYLVYGYGREGGESCCIEKHQFSSEEDFLFLKSRLDSIHSGFNQTIMNVMTSENACD